ncbi:MAG: YjbQ family protein [Candidatus Omnitrophica bacterium]|nr:YjbQ family protein [Candidatus Omnitrophota bacterium]
MSHEIKTINVPTSAVKEIIDITSDISLVVRESGVRSGICYVFVPHTTAAVTINENADPDVKSDILKGFDSIVPEKIGYRHAEGNSPAHIRTTMTGSGENIMIDGGRLVLGTWQGVYFCEFDGPRKRKVYVKILEG